ncbi:Por secretion system C-terminal sorting domain-containing protein [Tangfeifania diversioriginum]|uniref:Por secretion system C-terminal sorting domain-containing protein n=1 Tax=Tangfeifania diversioriginum TaxID=1168035 RepID=A0A1M6H3C8_9BACT|nr:discoidin domain-containing protein [Tangfeifania diversioriginum]SHJ16669.1 Por secretion system C-terminal sorting domain-containing protein [Tangfeifania diversioriginum]
MLKIHFSLFVVLIFCCVESINSQTQFTPYDDLPGIDKVYKPAFNETYTGWKKMLYEFPVNLHEIENDFNSYRLKNSNEKSPVIKYYKLWRRVIENYADGDGEIILPDVETYRKKQFNEQQKALFSQKSAQSDPSNWQFLGPKETFWQNETNLNEAFKTPEGDPKQCPWQANVYAFDVSKTNPDVLYCGTETGYISKTINKGLTWELLGKNYPFGGGAPAVAIHPENADTVYVSAGNQMHKTTDGGQTWMPLLQPSEQFGAVRLKIHPENPDIIIAASSSGFFMTEDSGENWSRKWSNAVWDVEFKPDNPSVIYALTKNLAGVFQVIVSENTGRSFNVDDNFPSTYPEESGGLLAVTPANPSLLYVTLLARENGEGIPFIIKGENSNGTFSWEETKKGQTIQKGGLGGFTNGQGYFDLVLEASPNDENLVFWGTCTLFKSTDGGYNFSKTGGYGGDFPIHPDIQDMQILPNGETWVATDGGMNFSTDYFTDLANYSSRTQGIVGSDMWGFDQGWNEDLIVGGRYHNGNTAIADFYDEKALRMGGAESPTGWVIKGKSRHVAFNDLGNGWILPKTAESLPEGRFIFSKFPNMDEYGGRRSNLVHHPNYYGTLYLGEGNGFWKSTDAGENFDLLHQFPDRVRYLQVSHKNPDVFYADVVGKGLYRSNDGGKLWEHKSALTNGQYGDLSWGGKLFFVISPFNEDKIYVCLQNGMWSADAGKIFVSEDGGDTWTDYTSGLNEYTKCMVIQPTPDETDLVYLFTNSKNGSRSKVFYRYEGQPYWNEFNSHYPAGMTVNLALPFYRDSKVRVAGNAGIWESSLAETTFQPIVNPWVEKPFYNCMEDTLYFNDHSILNHEGAQWNWEITPEPAYISDAGIRNPKVALGNPGTYDVTLTVEQDGETWSKTIHEMVSTTTCPSVNDCGNPAELNKEDWSLVYVDSEETVGEDGAAANAFDGDPDSFWHTEWYYSEPGQPHEIQIDLGRDYQISQLNYLPRQSSANGRVKNFELYVSNNTNNWGEAVAEGAFESGAGRKQIDFEAQSGQFVKFRSLSEQNGNPFTTVAELDFVGCISQNSTTSKMQQLAETGAYPIPANEQITVELPAGQGSPQWNYKMIDLTGKIVDAGRFSHVSPKHSFSLNGFEPGIYLMLLKNQNSATTYRIKFVVE